MRSAGATRYSIIAGHLNFKLKERQNNKDAQPSLIDAVIAFQRRFNQLQVWDDSLSCLQPQPYNLATQHHTQTKNAKMQAQMKMNVRQSSAVRSVQSRASTVSVRSEISYVMVKPDGVQRGLVGQIITRFEQKGFKIRALKMYNTPKEVAETHYQDLKSKPFYPALVDYIISGPVVCIVSVFVAWHSG